MSDMPETVEMKGSKRASRRHGGEAPNFSRATFTRVAKLLDPSTKKGKGQFMHLAQMAGVSRKAIRNWMLPESDPQHRAMPATAKRTIAILAHLAMTGYLNEKRMSEIIALEKAMVADQDVFQKVARRMSVALKKAGKASGRLGGSADTAAAAEASATVPTAAGSAHAAE